MGRASAIGIRPTQIILRPAGCHYRVHCTLTWYGSVQLHTPTTVVFHARCLQHAAQ